MLPASPNKKLKSLRIFEFFNARLYSLCNKKLLSAYIRGLKVKSLSSLNILKYGIFIDVPRVSEVEYVGVKKPDFLFIVGSG